MREWAKLSELKLGDFVEIDCGFDCIGDTETRRVGYIPGMGFFIDCSHGYHFLSGQLANDGDSLIGIYKVQNFPSLEPANLRGSDE